jgi:hypothetical protein
LVEKAEDYQWSSAAAHTGDENPDGLLDLEEWNLRFTRGYWRSVLEKGLCEAGLEERIREATRRGHPLGDGEFVDRVSRSLGRDVTPRIRAARPAGPCRPRP